MNPGFGTVEIAIAIQTAYVILWSALGAWCGIVAGLLSGKPRRAKATVRIWTVFVLSVLGCLGLAFLIGGLERDDGVPSVVRIIGVLAGLLEFWVGVAVGRRRSVWQPASRAPRHRKLGEHGGSG